jgi:phenylacetate-CoA ligase
MSAFWVKHLIYPLYELLTGRRILSKLRELEASQWKSRAELEALQLEKLRRLLNYACQNVPYYKRVFDQQGVSPQSIRSLEDFRRVPLLTKETIQEHRDELVSEAYRPDQLIPNHTGGSTGKPLRFYQDRQQRDYGSAAKLRCNRWAGWDFGKRTLRLWGHHADVAASRRLWGRLRSLVLNDYTFDTFRFSETDMTALAEQMKAHPVQTIIAYASSLYQFARYLEESRVAVPAPDGIISSTDMLYPAQCAVIERVFATSVFDRYGCREVSLIAAECPEHSGMHIDITRLVVEFLNDAGEPCRSGERGHIVITDLTNYAMPFIRYRIEDIGVPLDEPCPCGRGLPLMKELSGRKSDILRTPRGEFVSANALTTLLSDIPGLGQVQLVQERLGLLVVRVVKRAAYDEASEMKFRTQLAHYLGPKMDIRFEYVDDIPPLPSGKYRFSISHLDVAPGEEPGAV